MSNLATISRKLNKLESRFEDNIKKVWSENGLILRQISEEKLYKVKTKSGRDKYSSFEDYVEKRFEMKRANAYRLIDAANTLQAIEYVQNDENFVSQNGILGDSLLPKNESQIRPLMALNDDSERVHVWNKVINSGEKPTRDRVTEAVKEFQNNPEPVRVIDFEYKNLPDGVIASLHTGDNESYTPIEYIESVRAVMGEINVDPASNPYANERVNADIYYTEQTNGLDKEWNGKVWLNPPYASKLINQFVAKLIEEYDSGRCTEAIMLTNNSADTKWFHDSARHSSAVCFTKGRINFYKADDTTTSPTNGQTFFYFGNNIQAFTDEFKQYGMIVEVLADAE